MKDIPIEVQKALKSYFDKMDSQFPNLFHSFYLYGSISLGEYQDTYSDIDFVGIIHRKLSDIEQAKLQQIHEELQAEIPSIIFDGWYFVQEDFHLLQEKPATGLRVNEGRILGSVPYKKDSIDAFQLKVYGITIKGLQASDLRFAPDWNILLSNMKDNVNSYWVNLLNRSRMATIENIEDIEWAVLGISRLFYTFQERDIISKVGAGEYAMRNLPSKWHPILQEAINYRKGNLESCYASKEIRSEDAKAYLEFLIQMCNELYDKQESYAIE